MLHDMTTWSESTKRGRWCQSRMASMTFSRTPLQTGQMQFYWERWWWNIKAVIQQQHWRHIWLGIPHSRSMSLVLWRQHRKQVHSHWINGVYSNRCKDEHSLTDCISKTKGRVTGNSFFNFRLGSKSENLQW